MDTEDEKVTPYIKENVNWTIKENLKSRRERTPEEEEWIRIQVEFRFGKWYQKILIGKKDIYPKKNFINTNRNLTSSDVTYKKIKEAYNGWGEYQYGEMLGQILIYNILSEIKSDILPILMVDFMGSYPYPLWTYNRLVEDNNHILFPLCFHRIEASKGLEDTTKWTKKIINLFLEELLVVH
jgi:hypothetical protein